MLAADVREISTVRHVHNSFDQLKLSYLMVNLVDIYGEDVERQRQVRNIIDALFKKNVYISRGMLIMFLIFYAFPLLWQLFETRPLAVRCLNGVCLVSVILFEYVELLKMKFSPWEYISSFRNIIT